MERMDTVRIPVPETTRIVAHRGLSGLETENTTAAFLAAGNRAGIDGIETDIRRTADGQFVLFHDDTSLRLSGDEFSIGGCTLETLRAVSLRDRCTGRKRPDLRIATPEEYIGICKKYGKFCYAELKDDFAAAEIRRIVELFEKEDYLDHTVFLSFFYGGCLKLRTMLPQQKIQFLTEDVSDELIDHLQKDRLDIDILHTRLTEERVQAMHRAGITVNVWVADNADDARRLIRWGVDAITTNLLEAERNGCSQF